MPFVRRTRGPRPDEEAAQRLADAVLARDSRAALAFVKRTAFDPPSAAFDAAFSGGD